MRNLTILYNILYFEIVKKEDLSCGLCAEIDRLYYKKIISLLEFRKLTKHFKSQKPTWYRNRMFYKHKHYIGQSWWWSVSGTEQRKAFIGMLIIKTKSFYLL